MMRARIARLSLCVQLLLLAACSGLRSGGPTHATPDAGRDAGTLPDASVAERGTDASTGTDASLPSADAPRGKVRGVVYGVALQDLAGVRVNAGGRSTTPGDSGFFFLDDALAGAHANVFARVTGYSLGHASVPVRAGETTNVILQLTPLTRAPIAAPTVRQSVSLGATAGEGTLSLTPGTLQTVYGTDVVGKAVMDSATLGSDVAPSDMLVEKNGARERFARLGMVELHVRQPTAELMLVKPANLTFAVNKPRDLQKNVAVYRFDESAGVFREHASVAYDAKQQAVTISISTFGIYAAAEPLADASCAKIIVTDSADAPIPQAALVFANEREAMQLQADAAGHACLAVTLAQSFHYRAFGRTAAGLVEVLAPSPSMAPDTVLACGSVSCADLGRAHGLVAQAACLRGTIARTAVPTDVAASFDATNPLHRLRTGESFCIDALAPAQIMFTANDLDCGAPVSIATQDAAGTCGEDSCVDLGTITCCSTRDSCDNGLDDDCDGKVDEGCDCANTACAKPRAKTPPSGSSCCTSDHLCGQRAPGRSTCFEDEAVSKTTSACPSEMITSTLRTAMLAGCCRMDGRCGVLDVDFACVAREDAKTLFQLAAPLSAMACTYP